MWRSGPFLPSWQVRSGNILTKHTAVTVTLQNSTNSRFTIVPSPNLSPPVRLHRCSRLVGSGIFIQRAAELRCGLCRTVIRGWLHSDDDFSVKRKSLPFLLQCAWIMNWFIFVCQRAAREQRFVTILSVLNVRSAPPSPPSSKTQTFVVVLKKKKNTKKEKLAVFLMSGVLL